MHQGTEECQNHSVPSQDGYSMQLGSPLSGKLKPESPLWYLEMEEMFELEYEDQSQWKKPSVQSPRGSPFGSPESPTPLMLFKDYNSPNFTLKHSPPLPDDAPVQSHY